MIPPAAPSAATPSQSATAGRRPEVALVGNPNTGKTTLFNALSGLNHRTGNYPGVTVETKKGQTTCEGRTIDLIDLPGTYSLAPRSPDEMVAVDVLLGRQTGEPRPDVILAIVDASNLERNLYLTTQALELGLPVVVALNMVDVAEGQGIRIDAARLSKQLGVPVVPIQANRKRGLDELRRVLSQAVGFPPPTYTAPFPEPFEREVASLRASVGEDMPPFLVRRLLLDVGGYTEERAVRALGDAVREKVRAARGRLREAGCPVPAVESRARYGWLRTVTAGCVERPATRPVTWTDRLDRVLTHRVWGTLVFLGVMFLVFQSIFTWAKPLMDLILAGKDALADATRSMLPPGPLTSLLVDGVINGVGSVVVFLPQILILFAFIAMLEDCGYMARAAFLMDRIMARAGLSGKSFIPLLSSVACAVPGIMAARVIEDRRDRLATILVAPLMSCSARLPVYLLLVGAFLSGPGRPFWLPGLVLFCMYALGIVLAPIVAWSLKRTLLRGQTPVFVMEMPTYKRPSLRVVGRRVFDSAWAFLRRAGTIILASMVLVWALLYFPHGPAYDREKATLSQQRDEEKEANGEESARAAELEGQINELDGRWRRESYLGQFGRWMEPAVRPLGWDWRIGVAALASFPAREVVVATLGLLFDVGEAEAPEDGSWAGTPLANSLSAATHADHTPLFTVPVALSLMVFFALCCQCASTLAVIRRETGNWGWVVFTFVYMTVLAYLGALVVFQVGRLFV